MGLDNGIKIYGRINPKDIPNFVELPFEFELAKERQEGEEFGLEICYWRKCWGLRETILEVLHGSEDNTYFDVEAEDIPAIIRAITPFFSKEYWQDYSNSIWEFEEIFEYSLVQQMINLKWLHSYLKEHPDIKCVFYDSY